jgi:hypothetical protein
VLWLRTQVWRLSGAQAEIDALNQELDRVRMSEEFLTARLKALAAVAVEHEVRERAERVVSAPMPPKREVVLAHTAADVVARIKGPIKVNDATAVEVEL